MPIYLSIITPTYNRKELVVQTIESALQFARQTDESIEIIIVDDASTDGTYDFLCNKYKKKHNHTHVKLIQANSNLGVTGAKNLGAANASGKWLLFIDSDDLLIPQASSDLMKVLYQQKDFPIIFFRCKDIETEKLIGPYQNVSYELSLTKFLNRGTPGECLPVIQSSFFSKFSYNREIKGGEGLTYAFIIQNFGPAKVDPLVVRRFRTNNIDRISLRKRFSTDRLTIGKYHYLILKNFFRYLDIIMIAKTLLKIIYYLWSSLIRKPKGKYL